MDNALNANRFSCPTLNYTDRVFSQLLQNRIEIDNPASELSSRNHQIFQAGFLGKLEKHRFDSKFGAHVKHAKNLFCN